MLLPHRFLHSGGDPAYHYQLEPAEAMTPTYVITSVNVESVNTQFDQIITYEHHQQHAPDILVLHEHRVAEKGLEATVKKFKDHDWTLTALPAPQDKGRVHAGVAVATRPGIRFQRHEQDLAHWQQQGRLLIGSLIGPNGKLICELLGIYSFSDPAHHQQERRQLIEQVEAWIAPRHRLPLIVMGDFNYDVYSYPTTAKWLSAGLLVDTLGLHEHPRVPTHISGSILDYALATETLMKMCIHADTQTEFTFPSHRGIQVHLRATPQSLTSYLNAPPLPTNRLVRLRIAQLPEANATPAAYSNALALGDVDKAHQLWCARWRTSWCRRATLREKMSRMPLWVVLLLPQPKLSIQLNDTPAPTIILWRCGNLCTRSTC